MALPLLFVACTTSSAPVHVPQGASPIDTGSHPNCSCLLVDLTTSAAPTRAIDLATIRERAESEPTLCAYEVLVDDPTVAHAPNTELRPYLLQAEGAPVDLVIRPGAKGAPRVVAATDDAQVRAACSQAF